jgi:Sulfotransferase family
MTVASMESLVEQAIAASGLSDFGADGWQTGLERLLDAVGYDLGDDPTSTHTVEKMILGRLTSRLQVEAWYDQHRDHPPKPVQGPLVIVGLPRTATTALQYLIAVDPQFRYPRQWEMAVPVPPPDVATEAGDPRRLAAARRGPDVRHIRSVDGPTEDGFIHALNFGHQEMALPVPTYSRWWRKADLTSTFTYQERVLRLLHSNRPPSRWLLKAPAYLFHLPEMSRHYPDARFVMTHRDPAVALPSTCSVVLDARHDVLPCFAIEKVSLGPEMVAHFSEGVRRAMAARPLVGEERFLDVSQEQVEQDPVGTVARIYRFAGLDLSDDVKTAMRQWAEDNRRGTRGAHHYTAEEFGLSRDSIRQAFSEYYQLFADHLSSTTTS